MFDGIKRAIVRHEAEEAGKKLKEDPMIDKLKRNKFVCGLIVWALTGATAWATAGCAPVYDLNILGLLHVSKCSTALFVLATIASFLTGAGIMTSDHHEAVIQGVVPPAGPPVK